jgi:membrane fusion protein (multidrug efflux system)
MSARLRYTLRVLFTRLRRPGFVRYGLLIMGPLALALVGAYYYATGGRLVTTENAYVKADKIAISTDVSGRVVAVRVKENQIVKKGQVLFELDREPFQIALEKAEAEMRQVRTEIKALQELFVEKTAEMARGDKDLAFFQGVFDKRRRLLKRGVVSQDRFDTAARNLEATRNRTDSVRQELGRIRTRLGGTPDLAIDGHPEVRVAETRRNQARLDLSHTVIKAPATGIVTKNDLQIGEHVTMGRPVFSTVGWSDIWVEANLKETELTHVREGQAATISVDAYPDFAWKARVASIAPATGAEFSILPPQNATGNWVKVVQRVPVRLELAANSDAPPLRAGMSVFVTIDTLHERDLPPFIASAVAFIKGNEDR